jgi:hypothetical protein
VECKKFLHSCKHKQKNHGKEYLGRRNKRGVIAYFAIGRALLLCSDQVAT